MQSAVRCAPVSFPPLIDVEEQGVRGCHRTRHSGRRLPCDIWTGPVVRPRRSSAPRLVSAPVFLLGKSIALLPVVGGAAEVVQRRCALIPRCDPRLCHCRRDPCADQALDRCRTGRGEIELMLRRRPSRGPSASVADQILHVTTLASEPCDPPIGAGGGRVSAGVPFVARDVGHWAARLRVVEIPPSLPHYARSNGVSQPTCAYVTMGRR